MTAHRIGFLIWPSTKALTLALAEEALRVAQRVHPEVVYELSFLQAEAPGEEAASTAWQLPGEPWAGKLEGCQNWRWQDDFAERFPKVIATSHLFDWDRDRLTACGGMSVLDLLLAVLARDHGAELAGAVSEELVVERIREGGERQRIPLQNRLGSSHPKLTQAVLLMEANIEEPLTTDEIAQHVCVSRRQLERIFKQYLNRVPSQYYLELRLNKARQMLMQTSKSIIQIGLSCGFSSGPHFSSAYRNFFGATPREDRNQRRSSSPFELSSVPSERG